MLSQVDRVLDCVESLADEAVAFTSDLIRIPTVNPPGANYADCARLIGGTLERSGFEVEYHTPDGRPEHTPTHPRVNVVGTRRGRAAHPLVHLNGHFDVVPAGAGWTIDPFGGEVRRGRIWGRGACDMKAGLAAAVFAAEAIRRAGVDLGGTIEISGTVDEESGGSAGVGWLAQQGRISAARTDFAIIPEPFGVDRISVGHRGVYWFEVETRGRVAHGSMPFHGVNAIEHMSAVIEEIRRRLTPQLASRVSGMPIVPDEARYATLNVNAIAGGQPIDAIQTPCVADRCRAVFDRRYLIEEPFEDVRQEIGALLEGIAATRPDFDYALRDLLVVEPIETPSGSPVITVLESAIERVLDRPATLVASPGTYDQKHFARLAGVPHCVAYGPGILDIAHQPDEYCEIADLVNATKVIALAVLELTGSL